MRRSLALLAVAACGGPLVVVANPAPPAPQQPAPPPARSVARWIVPPELARVASALAVDGKQLMVGDRGVRFLVDGEKITGAATLLPEAIADVTRLGDRFVFIGHTGATFVTKGPLDAPDEAHPAPAPGLLVQAVGAKALLLVREPGGAFRRSTDGGKTWTASPFVIPDGAKFLGMVGATSGEVLVVGLPQRAWVTTDGLSFQPLATNGVGARGVARGPDGSAYLEGLTKAGVLRGSPPRLELAEVPASPALPRKPTPARSETRHLLAGTRHVVTRTAVIDPDADAGKFVPSAMKIDTVASLEVAVARLGDAPTKFAPITAKLRAHRRLEVAAWEGTVYLGALERSEKDEVFRIRRTTNDGVSWEVVAELSGTFDFPPRLSVGPDGLLVLGSVSRGTTTESLVLRKGVWEPLPFDGGVHQIIFDLPRKRAWVRGNATHTTDLALREPKHLPLQPPLPSGPATLDKDGTLLAVGDGAVQVVDVAGNRSKRPLPAEAFDTTLTGLRGFASGEGSYGYETDDGGVHWTRVFSATLHPPMCSDEGCVFADGVVRVGWDLPAAAGVVLPPAASSMVLSAPSADPPPPLVTTPQKPSLRCKKTGKSVDLKYWARASVGHGAVRWAAVGGGGLAFLDSKGALHETPAPAPKPKPKPKGAESSAYVVRTVESLVPGGVVVLHLGYEYAAKFSGQKNPVDITAHWLTYATGKVSTATLERVPPFRVGSSGAEVRVAVVDDGRLLVAAAGPSPLYLVGADGKITTYDKPSWLAGLDLADAVAAGDTLTLIARTYNSADLLIAETLDSKTWKQVAWSFGTSATLERVGAKPFARVSGRRIPLLAPPPDPPLGVEPLAPPKSDVACVPPRTADKVESVPDPTGSTLELADFKVDAVGGDLWVTDAGAASCTLAHAYGVGDKQAWVFPHDLAHGVLVVDGHEVHVLSCKSVP